MSSTIASVAKAILDADMANPPLTKDQAEKMALEEILEFISRHCAKNDIAYNAKTATSLLKAGNTVETVISEMAPAAPPPPAKPDDDDDFRY